MLNLSQIIELKSSHITSHTLNILGMTDCNVQNLINNICVHRSGTYLEIGTYQGSTFCPAILNTNISKAICVDFFTESGPNGIESHRILLQNISDTHHSCEV